MTFRAIIDHIIASIQKQCLIFKLLLIIESRKPLILLCFSLSSVRTSASRRRKRHIACGDFFTKATGALILLRLLFRKRSRQVARLTCKCARCRFVGYQPFSVRALRTLEKFVLLRLQGNTLIPCAFCYKENARQ